MGKSKIEWCDATWSPITGCTPISEGCTHCYAKRMATRMAGRYGYPADDPFRVTFHPERINDPIGWKKPRRIFVCSMADLFHQDVTDAYIDKIWGVMSMADRHTFLILTKRADRMADVVPTLAARHACMNGSRWPLPNVWLGVTAENQARADERIPILLQIPAAVRFVSVEPMLGLVNLTDRSWWDHRYTYGFIPGVSRPLDWVICGGETGPGARPMHPDWVRSLRDQCQAARVPFFFKGWGDWLPEEIASGLWPEKANGDPIMGCRKTHTWGDGLSSIKHGKKASGRLLDGREWNEFPVEAKE